MYTATTFDIVLITLGFFIMLGAVLLYFRLNRRMQLIIEQVDTLTIFLFRTYIVLMLFFLVGYGFFDALYLLHIHYNPITLISFIFFFGAIFVLIGMLVQTRLTQCIFSSNTQMIRILVNAVEARDLNLKGHSMHVMSLSLMIYDAMSKNHRELIDRQKLEYASILHDIGKLGIPESVLNKPGKLDEAEWQLMREHPRIGVNILSGIHGMEDIKQWILCHHERLDGKGYYEIAADDIPLASRIIGMADAYSAIVMRRSYKKEVPHDKAVALLRQCVGTQFDPYVFSIFEMLECAALEQLLTKIQS